MDQQLGKIPWKKTGWRVEIRECFFSHGDFF
jgi:hypothetical protein